MKNVYIIEDDPALRRLLGRYFARREDLTIHIAPEPLLCPLHPQYGRGNELDAPPCDLLIVDNQLPVMTGLEFVRQFGHPVRHKAVMSASLSPADLAQARKLGCKVFRKPFRLQELSDWIDSTETAPLPLHLAG